MSERPERPATPAVVLVRPQHEGNVGAAARAMANMGLTDLHLVEPAVELGGLARALAVGAREILERHRRHDSLASALAPFDRAVGTTSGRDRLLQQSVIGADELAGSLASRPTERVALVFGPETSGLTTEEIAQLDPLVTIPCAARQPTLNLSQAVLLVGYELARSSVGAAPRERRAVAATVGEIDQLLEHVDRVLRAIGFERDDTYRGVVHDLRRLAGRTGPTSREIQILHGICRRTLNALAAARPEPPR